MALLFLLVGISLLISRATLIASPTNGFLTRPSKRPEIHSATNVSGDQLTERFGRATWRIAGLTSTIAIINEILRLDCSNLVNSNKLC